MQFNSLLGSCVHSGGDGAPPDPDGGHSLCTLKLAVRGAMSDVEKIYKESLVGDHAANGEAENAVNDVKRQVHVVKEKEQQHVPTDHATRGCRDAGANCLTRYRIGEDGKTAEQGRIRNRWLEPVLEFGERIHSRPALAQEPRSELQPRLIEGTLCGISF